MRILDISVPISKTMPVWPGDPHVCLRPLSNIEDGDAASVTEIQMSVHTGTHIDAASHYIAGAQTIDQLPLEKLVGRVLVMEIDPSERTITEDVLKSHGFNKKMTNIKKVLFKTSNSILWKTSPFEFNNNYVGINSSGAVYLANFDLDLIGIDYLSIAPFDETRQPHVILLKKEIILLEGINLSNVSEGYYELYCLPMNLEGCEGAPARAILVHQS